MSKTIHYLDLPLLTSTSDITPWLEVLGRLGFKARPDTGTKIEYKNSGLVLNSVNGNSLHMQTITGNYIIGTSIINSTLSTSISYRFAYVKFGDEGIAFTVVKANERANTLKAAITKCGDNKWFCYSTNYMWKTGTGNAESAITVVNFKVTPDSMLLVPIKYYGDIISDLYIAIYGPSSSSNMFICHVGTKAYLVFYNDAPFAIDVDTIWDDEDYPKPKPKKLLLVDWDFTQSLTDSIMGETVRIDNATFVQGEGIKSNSNSTWGNVIAFTQKDFNFEGKTVEIDFSKLTIEDDGVYDHSLILIHHLTGEYGENISTFMPNPNWKANLRNQAQLYNETTSITNFEDCTFKFVFTNGNMLVTVDDNVLYDGGTIVDGLSSWQIGHNWGEFIVTGMRIYTNE